MADTFSDQAADLARNTAAVFRSFATLLTELAIAADAAGLDAIASGAKQAARLARRHAAVHETIARDYAEDTLVGRVGAAE